MASSGTGLPSTSFLLLSSLLAQHHGREALAAVHAAGLRVEATHTLALDAVAAERLLRVLVLPSEATGPSSAASGDDGGSGGAGAGAPRSRPPSAGAPHGGALQGQPLTSGLSASVSATLRRAEKGGLRLGDSMAIFELMEQRARPSVDEVELFSREAGACTALELSCVDPRVDVVARAAELAAALRQRYLPSGTAQHVFAPPAREAARRALHLLHEAAIRQAAQRGAGAAAAAGGDLRGPVTAALPTPAAAQAAARFARPPTDKSHLVDMDALMDWVFPHGQQFPRSTGRLVLFALHGPLAGGTLLTGSRGASRALTESELLAMIAEVERDDMLAVYTAGSVAGDVAQVLTDVRAASRGLPRMSRAQVAALLADLPRDSRGRCSFHDVQKRVLGARLQRVEDLRVMFAAVATSDRERGLAASMRFCAPQPAFGRGRLAESLALSHGRLMAMERHGGADGAGALATAFTLSAREAQRVRSGADAAGAAGGAGAVAVTDGGLGLGLGLTERGGFGGGFSGGGGFGGSGGGVTLGLGASGFGGGAGTFHQGDPEAQPRHSQRLSATGNVVGGLDIKHKMGEVESFRVNEGLMHRNTFMVGNVFEATQSKFTTSMAANTKIIRGDLPGSIDRFDRTAPLGAHKPRGTRVPGGVPMLDFMPKARS